MTVTDSETRNLDTPPGATGDSPAAPARAGARLPVTQRARQLWAGTRAAGRNWWAWTAQPASLADTWTASKVDPRRVPGNAGTLSVLWRISNATDRLIMFALILAAPTALTGPLRWAATRPTRRWGLYIALTAFTATTVAHTLLGRS